MGFDDWDPGAPGGGPEDGWGNPQWQPGGSGQGPGQNAGSGQPNRGGQAYRDPRGDDWLRRIERGGTPAEAAVEAGGGGSRASAGARLEVVEMSGAGRLAFPGAGREPAKIRLDGDGFSLEVGGGRPVRAAYRDLSLIAINEGTALLVLGDGPDAMRWLLDRFGDRIGPLVRELRERRLRQRLADALVEVPDDPVELVEFSFTLAAGAPSVSSVAAQPASVSSASSAAPAAPAAPAASAGVGQSVVHPWGFVVAPVDERVDWIHFRRAAIRKVTSPSAGTVCVDGVPGRLELRGLGASSSRWANVLTKLRDGAFEDAARFIEQRLPDAPFAVRRRAGELLVDGRPTRPQELGDAWETVEAAVLTEPSFAESYRALVAAAGPGAPRWLAMAPADPGGQQPKVWFFVALPGNLVAMELVSEGSHATYCFRVMPRASYSGQGPDALGSAADDTVTAVSEALVDARFLREPIALPAEQLRLPAYLRYRLALAALPTLAEARRRFVARIVHSSAEGWNTAVQDLIAWHGACRDEVAEWPGRAAEEAQVLAAAGGAGEAPAAAGETGTALAAGASDPDGSDGAPERPKITGKPG